MHKILLPSCGVTLTKLFHVFFNYLTIGVELGDKTWQLGVIRVGESIGAVNNFLKLKFRKIFSKLVLGQSYPRMGLL